MLLTNGEIFNAKEPLGTLLQMELPVQISHDLAVMAGKLADQYKVIEGVRCGLIQKYGELDEKTKQTVVKQDGETFEKFASEFNELMGIEVELVIQKVTLPAEIDGKPLKVKPITLMALEKFVGV